MLKTLFAALLILPHFAVFVAAGVYEYRKWREIDPEIRPSFSQYLSRTAPTPQDGSATDTAAKTEDTETETGKS